jgi:hypothetical protein
VAVRRRNAVLTRLLLDHGADPAAADLTGLCVMDCAAKLRRDSELVLALTEALERVKVKEKREKETTEEEEKGKRLVEEEEEEEKSQEGLTLLEELLEETGSLSSPAPPLSLTEDNWVASLASDSDSDRDVEMSADVTKVDGPRTSPVPSPSPPRPAAATSSNGDRPSMRPVPPNPNPNPPVDGRPERPKPNPMRLSRLQVSASRAINSTGVNAVDHIVPAEPCTAASVQSGSYVYSSPERTRRDNSSLSSSPAVPFSISPPSPSIADSADASPHRQHSFSLFSNSNGTALSSGDRNKSVLILYQFLPLTLSYSLTPLSPV